MTVHLARHGRTAYNLEGRFQGQGPVPLDATGRFQAGELAERCAELELHSFWSSPLVRARDTAAIVGRRIGLEPVEDPRYAETDTGDWEHRSFVEVEAEDPDGFAAFLRTDAQFAFPGGESYAEHQERVEAALADLFADSRALPALVVCHGGTIRVALASWGDDSARGWQMPNTALVTLHADGTVEGR